MPYLRQLVRQVWQPFLSVPPEWAGSLLAVNGAGRSAIANTANATIRKGFCKDNLCLLSFICVRYQMWSPSLASFAVVVIGVGVKRLRDLKWWHWLMVVIVGFGILGSVVPDSTDPDSTVDQASPAWLLIPLLIVVLIALGMRRKRRISAAIESAKITPEKLQAEISVLQEALDFFGNHESQHNEAEPSGIVAQRDEHIIADVSEVGLVESRRGPTQFKGGSTGVSFRLTKRISVRQSGMKGRVVQGEESPTLIDTGRFIVSDKRAVFVGAKQSREFEWQKLLAYTTQTLDKKSAILFLPVSNRQKTSGIAADTSSIEQIHQRVSFGVAVATGRKDDFLEGLRRELQEARDELAALQEMNLNP